MMRRTDSALPAKSSTQKLSLSLGQAVVSQGGTGK